MFINPDEVANVLELANGTAIYFSTGGHYVNVDSPIDIVVERLTNGE